MKKIYTYLLILLLFFCINLSSLELTGVWSDLGRIHPSDRNNMMFSWGESAMAGNGRSIAIDDKGENPRFYVSGFGSFPIIEVIAIDDDTSKLVFYFILEDKNYDCIFHWIDEEQYWIEDIEGISFFPTGKEWVYIKLDGPEPPISIDK